MRLLLGSAVLMSALVGCTPAYGTQTCKTSSDCGSQVCLALCNLPDGGPPPADELSTCGKACTQDSDCTDLGLKKPVCGSNQCGGPMTCFDNPF